MGIRQKVSKIIKLYIVMFYRKDNFQTSMTEFVVQKITDRHPEPTKRILCLTEATILERDPQTYSVRYTSMNINDIRCGKYSA